MVLEAIRYRRGSLQVLDQLQLPHRTHYDPIEGCKDAWQSIRSMRVRGAPAIAMVAALGLAVELHRLPSHDASDVKKTIDEKLDYLLTSRPTAVNLADAAVKLKKVVHDAAGLPGATNSAIADAYIATAEDMLENDVRDNKAIGEYGAEWILRHSHSSSAQSVSVLTHCNTGALATAGWGTALGVVRSLYERGGLRHAFCTETRPYNQGARLTAYELVHDQIPSTLITDSMAAALLHLRGESHNITAIVVGADRVAANGDTANKIGTYALSLIAKHHGVKFLVAAPRTTIDMRTESGRFIKIEERSEEELTSIRGSVIRDHKIDLDSPAETVSIAASGIGVWNPAFDVTPAELIDGIITEVGVVEKDETGQFPLHKLMATTSSVNGSAHTR